MITVKAAAPDEGQQYFVLIFDCGGDHQVRTRLKEEHQGLTEAGYEKIICIRDVRPDFSRAEIAQLAAGLEKGLIPGLVPVDFILSTMELEAWFLAEFNHYVKIDPLITNEAIFAAIGFDPAIDDPATRDEPANDLRQCYALGGKTYEKSESGRTISALDYAYIYTNLVCRIPEIQRIANHIDEFLTPA
ncbi:hypothetical protein [Pseudomonas umsongensis]|uniref:DUF4276 family protein n=1 Tax=Pseudomonas umsongensis TaxID=198618 RepID=A0AAE6ZV36_9PSED|nr:hypothetical protein [Pseudomonas umsongensis]QJC78859.1 hypothetical protein HGP31_11235 [Pseudomonas umsongensis]